MALLAASAQSADKPTPAVTALALTPDGKGWVTGSQAGVTVQGGKSLAVELDHVLALAFSPDGTRLAIGGGSPAESGSVELWSWPACKRVGKLAGHDDVVHAVAWLPDGKTLATASADQTVRLWDSAGKCVHTLRGHSGPVLALAVAPDGTLLCSGSADQTIRVWKTADGTLLRSMNNHLGAIHDLAFRPGGPQGVSPYLASASEDGSVRIWQPALGRMVRIVRLGTPVYRLGCSPDGGALHAGGKDGVLRTIDADSDAVLHTQRATPGRITALAVGGALRVGDSRGQTVALEHLKK